MLHAFKPFAVNEPNATLRLDQSQAGVVVRYLSPLPLRFRQWDGYDPQPSREFPNQWHLEAGTTDQRTQLDMLTVLVPHRAGEAAAWTAERLDNQTAVGVRLAAAGKPMIIAFRKAGVTGPASLGGLTFDAPMLLRAAPPER